MAPAAAFRALDGCRAVGWVEYSSIGARSLVRVYRPRDVRALLCDAGFTDVTTVVRHFQPSDAFLVAALGRWIPRLRDPHVHEWIGRRAGWYVVARGVRR